MHSVDVCVYICVPETMASVTYLRLYVDSVPRNPLAPWHAECSRVDAVLITRANRHTAMHAGSGAGCTQTRQGKPAQENYGGVRSVG
jgi:hypothetical protein